MSSGLLTCITCSVAFKEASDQRDHYKTDWHRYNLKRKVAELPPVKEADFANRMVKHEEQRKALNGETKSPTGYCVACSKSFATEKAYENHLKSKKHLVALKAFEEKENKDEIAKNRRNRKITEETAAEETMEEDADSDDEDYEEVDSDEWDEEDAISPNDCFFCSHHSSNNDKNLLHMSEKHSFFVPDLEYVINVDGLLTYIGCKVGQGKMCLTCSEKGKSFRSLDAVRKHMVDKGHCKIAFSGGDAIAEFADFYDYSSTYPEADDGGDHKEDHDVDMDPDEEVDLDAIDDTGYELVLPSGAKIGHRSLQRYYKQSLNPDKQLVLRKPSEKMLAHYSSSGAIGLTFKDAKKRAKDVTYFKQNQQKYQMKMGSKNNMIARHHFRDRTMVF